MTSLYVCLFLPYGGTFSLETSPFLTATTTEKTLSCFLLYGATEGGLQVEKRGAEYSAFYSDQWPASKQLPTQKKLEKGKKR
jgi:hypothetical protein